jgi:hypothetical protein
MPVVISDQGLHSGHANQICWIRTSSQVRGVPDSPRQPGPDPSCVAGTVGVTRPGFADVSGCTNRYAAASCSNPPNRVIRPCASVISRAVGRSAMNWRRRYLLSSRSFRSATYLFRATAAPCSDIQRVDHQASWSSGCFSWVTSREVRSCGLTRCLARDSSRRSASGVPRPGLPRQVSRRHTAADRLPDYRNRSITSEPDRLPGAAPPTGRPPIRPGDPILPAGGACSRVASSSVTGQRLTVGQ